MSKSILQNFLFTGHHLLSLLKRENIISSDSDDTDISLLLKKLNQSSMISINGSYIPPIPRGWFSRVCRKKGSNHVRVAICAYELFVYARSRGEEWFKITNVHSRIYGLSSDAKNDGLKVLAEMGLLELKERKGKTFLVRLIFPKGTFS
jgi:DNA-binding transcriptional ArsR family regulator